MDSLLKNKLTICIPTYNRARFLNWTLNRTHEDFPGVKVIVSDNNSDDETGRMEYPAHYSYIRQSRNIGAFPNMRSALLQARTKYCMYLGDDDYLLPEEVAKGVQFLEDNPDVAAYYAPCQLYDEVKQEANWNAFYPSQDKTFDRKDELWNFIITNHVWPEHAIYRRKDLELALLSREGQSAGGAAYWCFMDLAHLAVRGKVRFASEPYYRNITNHPRGLRRKLGDEQCLTDFDTYRWGLEYLAATLFNKNLGDPEANTLKRSIATGIRVFLYSRYEVAHKIHKANNRDLEAAMLECRMAIDSYTE